MVNRDDGFSMTIKDPDDPDNDSPIVTFLNTGDELFALKTDGIYKILTADTIDPDRKNLDTAHSYEKLYSIGCQSPFIARVAVQFEEIFKLVSFDNASSKELIQYLWNTNKYLIECATSAQNILNDSIPLLQKCDQLIEENKRSGFIPPLPKVPNLYINTRNFFNNAKLFLIESFKLFHIVFELPFNDREAAHFKKHIDWMSKKLGTNHPINKQLKLDIDWIRLISESRNALEHPKEGQKLTIHNFHVKSGNKFSPPALSYDLTTRINFKKEGVDLNRDLDTMLYNMLHFFEETALLSVDHQIRNDKMLALCKLKESQINDNCPVAYRVTAKPEFLKGYEQT